MPNVVDRFIDFESLMTNMKQFMIEQESNEKDEEFVRWFKDYIENLNGVEMCFEMLNTKITLTVGDIESEGE